MTHALDAMMVARLTDRADMFAARAKRALDVCEKAERDGLSLLLDSAEKTAYLYAKRCFRIRNGLRRRGVEV